MGLDVRGERVDGFVGLVAEGALVGLVADMAATNVLEESGGACCMREGEGGGTRGRWEERRRKRWEA